MVPHTFLMGLNDLIAERQTKLVADVHALWSTLPIPDWTAPVEEPNGWEPEHVEISRYLAGRSYKAAKDFWRESVFIWCRADVATYYLGGLLLSAIETLSRPDASRADLLLLNLYSFLNVEPLYDEVYDDILRTAPAVIPLVGQYGDLLQLCWIETRSLPEESEFIQRIRTLWRDRDTFERAVRALPPIS